MGGAGAGDAQHPASPRGLGQLPAPHAPALAVPAHGLLSLGLSGLSALTSLK